MNRTPMKPSLVEPTPLKRVVDSDINAWMETHLKRKRTPLLNRKVQAQKRVNPQQQRRSVPLVLNTLQALKKQRANLLQDTWTDQIHKKTLATTASRGKSSASPPNSLSQGINKKQTASIEVSEFNIFEKEDKSRKYLDSKRPQSKRNRVDKSRQKLSDILGFNITVNDYRPMKLFRCRVAKLQQNK